MATIPVFISSTFRDFHGERDLLAGPIRRALDERLAPHGCRVEIIDLRWGVAADDQDDEARQNAVLDVCLSEIDRARPFFVGLVGDRFGWVPPAHRIAFAANEAGLAGDYSNWSVTALEFEHGAFTRPPGESIFFLRGLDGVIPDGWRDNDVSGRNWIRERVKATGGRVVDYRAVADGTRITDLSEFETLATSLLGDGLEAHVRSDGAKMDSADAAEQLFFERHARAFTGRDSDVAAVASRIRAGRSVVITGEHGAGKSALWCAVVAELRRTQRVASTPVIRAGGVTSDFLLITHLSEQLGVPAYGLPTNFPAWWREKLDTVGPAVIAVDGLDELDEGFSRKQFNTVRGLPRRIVCLATTSMPEQIQALLVAGFEEYRLEPLPTIVVADVAIAIADNMRRRLPGDAVTALAREPRLPVWLHLAIAEIGALNEESFRTVDPGKDPIDELNRLVTRTLGALPAEPEGILTRVALRAERRFGSLAAEQFVQLLMTARAGLDPLELGNLTGLDELTVSGLRRAFSEVIETSPDDGCMHLTDPRARAVFTDMFAIADPGALHEQLAAHYRAASKDPEDTIPNCNLVWHAVQSSGPTRVSEFLHLYEPHTDWGRPVATILAQAYESGSPSRQSVQDVGEKGLEFVIFALTNVATISRVAMRRLADDIVHTASVFAASHRDSANARMLELIAAGMSGALHETEGDLAHGLVLYEQAVALGDRMTPTAFPDLTDPDINCNVQIHIVSANSALTAALGRAGRLTEAKERGDIAHELNKPVYIEEGDRYAVITTTVDTWVERFTISLARGEPQWVRFMAPNWLETCQKAVAYDPDHSDFTSALVGVRAAWGNACLLGGYWSEAITQFEDALAKASNEVHLDPTDETAIAVVAESHTGIARAYAGQRNYEAALLHSTQAMDHWQAAVKTAPDVLENLRAAARERVDHAEYLWRAERYDESWQACESAVADLRTQATDTASAVMKLHLSDALRMSARILLSTDRTQEAQDLLAEAAELARLLVELDDSNAAAHTAAAECLVLQARLVDARAMLRTIVGKFESYSPAHRLLLECPVPQPVDELDSYILAAETNAARGFVDRSDFGSRRAAAEALTEVAIRHAGNREYALAGEVFDRAIVMLVELRDELPRDKGIRRDLTIAWHNRHQAARATGDVKEAAFSMCQVARHIDAEPSLRDEARATLIELAEELATTDPEQAQECADAAKKLRGRWWKRT